MNDDDYDDYILPLRTFECIAADDCAASPETLATLLREDGVDFARTLRFHGIRPTKYDATRRRRHARLVVQRRIRGTA